jgi:hypothetical protein
VRTRADFEHLRALAWEEACVSMWFTFGSVLLGLGAIFLLWRVLQGHDTYRGLHACACPADGAPAFVALHAWRTAMGVALGRRPSLRVATCSRWPARANCNTACLAEVDGNCRLLAQSED